jgi:hypothetical protein
LAKKYKGIKVPVLGKNSDRNACTYMYSWDWIQNFQYLTQDVKFEVFMVMKILLWSLWWLQMFQRNLLPSCSGLNVMQDD